MPDCYALRVSGDSMSPNLLDGDIIVISPNATLIDGCIVAAYVEPLGDVVKVYTTRANGKVVLKPYNKAYDDIVLQPDKGRPAKIWGRVVMQQREL